MGTLTLTEVAGGTVAEHVVPVALDAMGGDHSPAETVKGALLAADEFGFRVALVGPPDVLGVELAKHPATAHVSIVPAAEVIGMDEEPAQAVRRKRSSSIAVGMDLVSRGEACGLVSAGSTGAVMATALLKLGRIRGIRRPALGALVPSAKGPTLFLDVGANAECKPQDLVQFAHMGATYMERAFGIQAPRVGLLNIGEEEHKGTDLVRETYRRLKQSNLNFIGNVEARHLSAGIAEVLVTDGFTGNMVVKAGEGVAEFILQGLKEVFLSTPRHKLAALLVRDGIERFRRSVDYSEFGGAPLLGVNGLVIVAHGRADARAIRSALRAAHETAHTDMMAVLRSLG